MRQVAAAGGHLELVDVLIAAGADVNKKRDNGSTALALAAKVHPCRIYASRNLLCAGSSYL